MRSRVRPPSPGKVPRLTLPARLSGVALGRSLGCTFGLSALGGFIARTVPLPDFQSIEFLSSYGIADNRREFLLYGALVASVFLGPLLAAWLPSSPRGFRRTSREGIEKREDAKAKPISESYVETPAPNRGRRRLPFWFGAAMLAGILFLLFVGPGVAFAPIDGHELVHFGYLNELDHGRFLNVDTRITYGPLSGYPIYLFMKLVSFSIYGFRLYWNFLTAAVLVAMLFVAYPYFRSKALFAILALYLILFTVARYYLPDENGIHGGFWGWANLLRHGWLPLAVLALDGPLNRSGSLWLRLLAGAIPVLGGFFAQETGPPGLVAMGILVLLAGRGAPSRPRLPDFVWFFTGALFAALLITLPAMLRGSFLDFLDATWRAPGLFLRGAGNLKYPALFAPGSDGISGAVLYYMLPGSFLFLLWLHWLRVLRGEAPVGFTLALYGVASYASVMVRADTPHVLNVTPSAILACFILADEMMPCFESRAGGRRRTRKALRLAVFVVLGLPAILARPGAGDLLQGGLGRVLHFRPSPPHGWLPIPLERARIWTPSATWFKNPAWTGDDPRIVPIMRSLTRGRETLILGNRASLYYFLSGSLCAVPYTDLSSQRQTQKDKDKMGKAFKDAKPEFLFVMEESHQDPARPEGFPYRNLAVRHGFVIYQRKDLSPVEVK